MYIETTGPQKLYLYIRTRYWKPGGLSLVREVLAKTSAVLSATLEWEHFILATSV